MSRNEKPDRQSRLKRALRRIVMLGSETTLALVVVLVFFVGFLGIISFSFPQGLSLRDLMLDPQMVARARGASALDLELAAEAGFDSFVALLSRTKRTVKGKRAGEITWGDAPEGTPLENFHSVQTYRRSFAEISFGERNVVDLGENSLIVIRHLEQDRRSRRRHASMLLLDGIFGGRTGGNADSVVPMELVTAHGSSMVVGRQTRHADFKVSVNPDRTSTFTMYGGSAKVVSGGRSVVLRPRQTITVTGNEPPGSPQTIPGLPSITTPADRYSVAFRAAPPRVRFGWKELAGVDAYRLTIGRDAELREPIHEERLEETGFVHGNLPPGRYYWSVAGLSGWAEGVRSKPRELVLIEDTEPPPLQVTFPDRTVERNLVLIKGSTEPGTEIFIGDIPVPTLASGRFEHAVNLERGVNVVVVEAVDSAGNIAYRSELVSAKYRELETVE